MKRDPFSTLGPGARAFVWVVLAVLLSVAAVAAYVVVFHRQTTIGQLLLVLLVLALLPLYFIVLHWFGSVLRQLGSEDRKERREQMRRVLAREFDGESERDEPR